MSAWPSPKGDGMRLTSLFSADGEFGFQSRYRMDGARVEHGNTLTGTCEFPSQYGSGFDKLNPSTSD